jgi:hypothetical protein
MPINSKAPSIARSLALPLQLLVEDVFCIGSFTGFSWEDRIRLKLSFLKATESARTVPKIRQEAIAID